MLGVVLAGGASQRFGSPKGLAQFGGKAMALYAADALSGICTELCIEAKPEAGYEALGLPLCCAPEAHAGKGPIAGMIAGLKQAQAQGLELAAFAACDMPFLTAAQFERLGAALDDANAAYAVTPDGAEPLCAIVRTSALAGLERALETEKIARAHVILDRAGAIGVWFFNPAPFYNINTREDFDGAARS